MNAQSAGRFGFVSLRCLQHAQDILFLKGLGRFAQGGLLTVFRGDGL